eukprot:13353027-Alexandrium_andersonii.AAC.1
MCIRDSSTEKLRPRPTSKASARVAWAIAAKGGPNTWPLRRRCTTNTESVCRVAETEPGRQRCLQ